MDGCAQLFGFQRGFHSSTSRLNLSRCCYSKPQNVWEKGVDVELTSGRMWAPADTMASKSGSGRGGGCGKMSAWQLGTGQGTSRPRPPFSRGLHSFTFQLNLSRV
jgi:hypothetical protein